MTAIPFSPGDLAGPVDDSRLTQKVFLSGAAGAGKTTYAVRHLLRLIEQGAQPDRTLVLVPQVTLGRPYQLALHDSEVAGGAVNLLTMTSLARRVIEVFWPLVAAPMGFADPTREPTFLNVETAQYYMARVARPFVEEGRFASVAIAEPRIVSQILDNLNRAALTRFPLDEIAERLTLAWGEERDSKRPTIFRLAAEIAAAFRAMCLQHNLVDFSLTMEAFAAHLMPNPLVRDYLHVGLDFLIAENVEEDHPLAHDLILDLLPSLQGALILYDEDGGYRNFLGADPDHAYALQGACEVVLRADASQVMAPPLAALGYSLNRALAAQFTPMPEALREVNLVEGYEVGSKRFYPQMIDWVVEATVNLVREGVPPREIAIVAPFVSDALRFALTYKLEEAGKAAGFPLETLAHRPSRALRDEPSARAMLTFAALAHPAWGLRPPVEDMSDALAVGIARFDPIRARLLTDIVYRRGKVDDIPTLSPFTRIQAEVQERISYLAGERYDHLREWLESYKAQVEHEGQAPLDHFWRRLFGEVLSQPGYGFHGDLEAGRIVAQLINSAQQFRQVLYPGDGQDWDAAGAEYVGFVNARLLPALFAQSWQDETSDAVFIAPASTFLMRNRFVDYQFWLDIGSAGWSERLEQPLTHPYVLRRDYPRAQFWSDDMEEEAQREALYKIAVGLVRRCRKKVFFAASDLGEAGYEQRGLLLKALLKALRSRDGDSSDEAEATAQDG